MKKDMALFFRGQGEVPPAKQVIRVRIRRREITRHLDAVIQNPGKTDKLAPVHLFFI